MILQPALVAEVTITAIISFISGAICGVITMTFIHNMKSKKGTKLET